MPAFGILLLASSKLVGTPCSSNEFADMKCYPLFFMPARSSSILICLQHFQWSERVICMQQFSLWPEAKYCLLNACDCFIRHRVLFFFTARHNIGQWTFAFTASPSSWIAQQQQQCSSIVIMVEFDSFVVGKWDMKLVWHYCGNVPSDTRHTILIRPC